jgi:FHS family L-fucose permease-like MFS transporter
MQLPSSQVSPAPSEKKYLFRVEGRDYGFVFCLVATLFLLWGFAHSLLDVLNKQFQNSLHVNKAQSGLVQATVYTGYFLMAIPAGLISRRYGYQRGILVGLTLFAVGAFWFYPATQIGKWTSLIHEVGNLFALSPDHALQWTSFGGFLLGLFVIALGLTCLETVANPYTTVLGAPEWAASRINLAQTFNALGWILGPLVGGVLIFSSTDRVNTSNEGLAVPYVGLGIVVTLMAVLFSRVKLPDIDPRSEADELGLSVSDPAFDQPLMRRPHFTLAVVAQFLYVAAQTGVNSFFINYIVENLPRWREQQASYLLAFGGMGLFMLGRFTGSLLLRKAAPHVVLATYGTINVALMALVAVGWGAISAAALVGCYLFMSIMFPTIFSLGLRGLGQHTKRASSALVMAIVGGAIAPPLMGALADHFSMRIGFLIPLFCFVGISLYGFVWRGLYARSAR